MDIMNGFLMTVGNKDYFLEASTTKRTDKVCSAFIERIGTDRNKSRDLIEHAKADKATLDDFRRRINVAVLDKRETESGKPFFIIRGNEFSYCYPMDDFMNDVVVF